MDTSGYLSVRDIALEMGVTMQSVRNWIGAGELEALQGGPRRAYRVPAASYQAFKQRRHTAGTAATVPTLQDGSVALDELLSTGEVARLLGTTARHVVDLCDRGELPYMLAGTHRRIRRGDVAALRARRALSGGGPLTEDQQRALWFGHALAAKVAADPFRVLERARRRAAKMLSDRPAGERLVREWVRIIDQGPDAVMRALTSSSPMSRELRQNLPFAGVLTEAERTKLISSFRRAHPRG